MGAKADAMMQMKNTYWSCCSCRDPIYRVRFSAVLSQTRGKPDGMNRVATGIGGIERERTGGEPDAINQVPTTFAAVYFYIEDRKLRQCTG
jgi:hypothetical protein